MLPQIPNIASDSASAKVDLDQKNPKRPPTPHQNVFGSQEEFSSWCEKHEHPHSENLAEVLGLGDEGIKMINSRNLSTNTQPNVLNESLSHEPEPETPEKYRHQISIETSERDSQRNPSQNHKKVADIEMGKYFKHHRKKFVSPTCSFCNYVCCGTVQGVNKLVRQSTTKFKQTVTACALVDVLLETIENGNVMSFDYVLLVMVASVLSALGLLSNSSVVVVASMLVSPIMGPLLAITFGLVCGQHDMVKSGVFNEIISLCICIIMGVLSGLIAGPFHEELGYPTSEMIVRGNWSNFVVGIFVALLSGIGVALSVAGQNTSCLVGVAISASLLPPAVNSGMFIGLHILTKTGAVEIESEKQINSLTYAGWSFALVLINCVLMVIMGIIVFKIKEVAPMENKPMIFQYGLKAKRDENRRLRAESSRPVETENNKDVKRVRFAAECPTVTNDSPMNDDWDGQSIWNDRRSDAGSHFTLNSAPGARIRKHESDVFSRPSYLSRRSGVTLPASLKSSRIVDALERIPAEYMLGDLQHSLRTVPTSKLEWN